MIERRHGVLKPKAALAVALMLICFAEPSCGQPFTPDYKAQQELAVRVSNGMSAFLDPESEPAENGVSRNRSLGSLAVSRNDRTEDKATNNSPRDEIAERGVSKVGIIFADRAQSSVYPSFTLREVPFHHVKIDDHFWNPRLKRLQEVTLPDLFDTAEQQGKIDNFRIVAGRKQGRLQLYNAPDSDVYKLIEAAAYSLAFRPAPKLRERVESYIDDIIAAQDDNGYLHTQYMIPRDDPRAPQDTKQNRKKLRTFGFGHKDRWVSLAEQWPYAYSQLYCAGHLFEAAVAWSRVTGDDRFLKSARRFADHIDYVFGEGTERIRGYADHPQVEIGLMKLYEETGDAKYLNLADRFSRYIAFSRPLDLGRKENGKPLHKQRRAYGHAVRTAYIYAGATDVVRATGADDLRAAMEALWGNVTAHKMYLHGGTGNGSKAEQHGHDDDLPILATYSETCASIAQGQWNHRLNLLTGHARHADLVELEAYNSALSGINLAGNKFFYANKLNIGTVRRDSPHRGLRTHYLFCCPAKVPGFLGGLGRWIYATDDEGITINQYIGSELATKIQEGHVSLKQRSELPWNGRCEIEVTEIPGETLKLRLRIPYWLRSPGPVPNGPYRYFGNAAGTPSISINGTAVATRPDDFGYLTVEVSAGDLIKLDFPISIRRVVTQERIAANRGRVALMRGPLLYCLEGLDNRFPVRHLVLPDDARISAEASDKLGGVVTLVGEGYITDDHSSVDFIAVPYFAWQNRGVHDLATLLIRRPDDVIEERPPSTEPMNTNG